MGNELILHFYKVLEGNEISQKLRKDAKSCGNA